MPDLMASEHGFRPLSHATKEVVLATAFNASGERLATGSADHRIRVFEKKEDDWHLLDTWRGHHGEIVDIQWGGGITGEILASIGSDLKLKIWHEDASEAPQSGRRFKAVFSQASGHGVVYAALAFIPAQHETLLAVITRDGLLSLLEPVEPGRADDWKEIDQFWVCGGGIARGVETSFRLGVQQAERPNAYALAAGLDARARSIAVTALHDVKIFRLLPSGYDGHGPYRFQAPVAELTGAAGLVRDVAWSSCTFRPHDLIATAAADGYVRIYELWTPGGAILDVPDAHIASQNSNPFSSVSLGPTSTLTNPSSPNPGLSSANTLSANMSSTNTLSANAPSIAASQLADLSSKVTRAARPPSGIGAGLAGASRARSASMQLDTDDIVHECRLVAELRHDGVWRVEWLPGGITLVSAGDTGRGHVWAMGNEGKWLEFADFGPD